MSLPTAAQVAESVSVASQPSASPARTQAFDFLEAVKANRLSCWPQCLEISITKSYDPAARVFALSIVDAAFMWE